MAVKKNKPAKGCGWCAYLGPGIRGIIAQGQIYDRDRLAEFIPGTEKLFDGWEGSENWIVYRGKISKYQLKKLEHWNKEKECWEVVA